MINERIKELRKALQLTQNEFADAVSIVRSHVSLLESGKREPSDLLIRSIVGAFPQVSEQWLRTGEGEMFQPPSTNTESALQRIGFSDITATLLQSYEALPGDRRDTILGYFKSVIEKISSGNVPKDEAAPEEEQKETPTDEVDYCDGAPKTIDEFASVVVEQIKAENSPRERSSQSANTDTSIG